MKPNILFIMTDQLRADALGCAGGPAGTPNIDALAAEGVRFTECNTVAPLCVPARVSLMTGRYPHSTGAWDNSAFVLSPDANLWTKEIKKAGYATSVFGKLHLHTNSGDMIGREYIVNGYGFDTVDEISGPHATLTSRTHMSEHWKAAGVLDAFCDDMAQRAALPCAVAKPSSLPPEEYYDVYVGKKGREYLDGYRGDKPWFCHVSFGGPHEPWDAPEPYAGMYDPALMPAAKPVTEESTSDRPRGEYDRLLAKRKLRCDDRLAGELWANYAGNITLIDKMIGEVIDTVKRRGEWDNTVVILTSDHGELNGDHGFVNKRNFFRGALNVPLIIRTPETAKRGGGVSDALVNLIDVGPTAAELAGAPIDYEQQGRSLCPVLRGESAENRDFILSEYAGEMMYMDRKWKYVANRSGEGYLLFDRVADPDETLNLIGNPGYSAVAAGLSEKLFRAVCSGNCLKPSPVQMPLDIKKVSCR